MVEYKVVLGTTQKENQDFDTILCQQEIMFSLFLVIHILFGKALLCHVYDIFLQAKKKKKDFMTMRATWHAQQIIIVHGEMQLNKI